MNFKENDRVQLEHLETGKTKTITVRWYDSRTGFLSLPDYNYYRVEENKEWCTPEWKVIQKLKRVKKKKKKITTRELKKISGLLD
jgi:hypothetical protein